MYERVCTFQVQYVQQQPQGYAPQQVKAEPVIALETI
jgi:hypothetical protein